MKIYKNNKAFSLIELLVVLAVIGLLTTLAVAGVNIARAKSKITAAQHDVDQIYKAITILANDSGEWPGHQVADEVCSVACGANEICGQDLNSASCANGLGDESSGIMANDTTTPYSNWQGPYMPDMPDDPWGREYFFDTDYEIRADGTPCDGDVSCVSAVVVGSYGPDGLGVPTGASPPAYGSDDIIKIIR